MSRNGRWIPYLDTGGVSYCLMPRHDFCYSVAVDVRLRVHRTWIMHRLHTEDVQTLMFPTYTKPPGRCISITYRHLYNMLDAPPISLVCLVLFAIPSTWPRTGLWVVSSSRSTSKDIALPVSRLFLKLKDYRGFASNIAACQCKTPNALGGCCSRAGAYKGVVHGVWRIYRV